MFWNVIDQTRQSVLKLILESQPVQNCYLAGGTALALLLGHRESIDFDWFTPDVFTPEQIESKLNPLTVSIDIPNLKMASLLDIGIMKLIAASQRGARKDFIDLYAIEQNGISMATLIQHLSDKFPGSSINYYHIVKSLVFFEDVEQEPMPRMLHTVEWHTVKDYFVRLQKPLLDCIPDV